MTTVKVKNKEKPETSEILAGIKQLQETMNEIQDSVSELTKKQKINMHDIESDIAKAFDIDFIKQVCYENEIHYDTVQLIVIYEHDDYNFAMDVIFERFGKLQDQLANLNIEMMYYHTNEVESNFLNDTTTVFKR